MDFICNHLSAEFCRPDFPWLQMITSTVLGVLMSVVLFFGKGIYRFLRFKDMKYWGVWYRYGIGFYEKNGSYPFHRARVFIFPLPPLATMIVSWNESYKYVGKLDVRAARAIYVYWSGLFHDEKMLSVYNEPIIVNKETYLVGVKSCVSKNWKPAANAEILAKRDMSRIEAEEVLIGYGKILVEDSVRVSAAYEGGR